MDIRVYEDETKQKLLHTVHVAQARTMTGDGAIPSSGSSLARYAKALLLAQNKASEEELERYYYEGDSARVDAESVNNQDPE